VRQRVVVTGLGVVSPIGIGHPQFWERLCAGQVGTGEIRSFDTEGFDSRHGGEVHGFDPGAYLRRLSPGAVARTTQFAVAVARMAWEDAGGPDLPPGRVGVCFGTTMGNQAVVERANDIWRAGEAELLVPPAAYPPTLIASQIACELGTSGPALVVPAACAAGNYAIGWGLDLIRAGRADVVIAGGSDAMSRGCFAVFNRLGAIAKDVCRPFDQGRSGMIVSEGAGALLLESAEHAARRGARVYAELLGYGISCDAYHPTAPHPEGRGAAESMQKALDSAGLEAAAVSYINAHGTGTKANDATESKAIRNVLGERADAVPISSIKSMIGHTMGAATAIEAVASVLAIHHRTLPPTANFVAPDPECLTNVVPNRAVRQEEVGVVLSNGFGFGGNISTVALGAAGT
jgi:3-oxoacyl-[acyl-carrier-protein] synthase II